MIDEEEVEDDTEDDAEVSDEEADEEMGEETGEETLAGKRCSGLNAQNAEVPARSHSDRHEKGRSFAATASGRRTVGEGDEETGEMTGEGVIPARGGCIKRPAMNAEAPANSLSDRMERNRCTARIATPETRNPQPGNESISNPKSKD